MIDDLIIIIPTKGRQNYLNRVSYYYSQFDMHTYICDAYQTECKIDSYDNIHYLWDPNKGFFEEMLDVVKNTKASFYLLSPDDDFIRYETLMNCYYKMLNNANLALGTGRQLFFNEQFDGNFIYYDYHNKISDSSVRLINKNNASFFEKNYQNIHWSLFSRECLIDALTKLDNAHFNYACFAEFILGIEALRHGGIYIDDGVMNYREDSNKPHWGSIAPGINWKNVLFSKDLRSDLKKLKTIYGCEYSFVRKCLINNMNAQYDLLKRIKYKIKHIFKGYCQIIHDVTMSERIANSFEHMMH